MIEFSYRIFHLLRFSTDGRKRVREETKKVDVHILVLATYDTKERRQKLMLERNIPSSIAHVFWILYFLRK